MTFGYEVKQASTPSMAVDITWKQGTTVVFERAHPIKYRIDCIARDTETNELKVFRGVDWDTPSPPRPVLPGRYVALAYVFILPSTFGIYNRDITPVRNSSE